VTVLLSGREGALPEPALAYEEGRLLTRAVPAPVADPR
jgi:glutamate racemase